MLIIAHLPKNVLADLQENYSVEEIRQMTAQEAFEKWCEWNGFINWASSITRALDGIRVAEISAVVSKLEKK